MSSAEIQAAVDEWVDSVLLGEPAGVTALRRAYVDHHLERCHRVLGLIPNPTQRGRLLELGSGLYLMTFLLRRFCNYDLELVQYWSKPNGLYESVLINRRGGNQIVLPFHQFNAEVDLFPYPDTSFDVVLNCEMIEHLLCNPVHVLAECHRVLMPGGVVVLSTPNALRLSNVIALLGGQNIYDKYCRESPYGRHAREYSPDELRRLFEEVGFRVRHLETRDVTQPAYGRWSRALARLMTGVIDFASKVKGREGWPSGWRGQQIFLVAERVGTARRTMPDFLFEAPDLAGPLIDAICRPRKEKVE